MDADISPGARILIGARISLDARIFTICRVFTGILSSVEFLLGARILPSAEFLLDADISVYIFSAYIFDYFFCIFIKYAPIF
jgi:hypothetical protein